jgi:hypothetical protein
MMTNREMAYEKAEAIARDKAEDIAKDAYDEAYHDTFNEVFQELLADNDDDDDEVAGEEDVMDMERIRELHNAGQPDDAIAQEVGWTVNDVRKLIEIIEEDD